MSKSGVIKKINDLGGNTIFEDRSGRIWIDGGGNPIGIRVYVYAFTTPGAGIAQTPDGKIFVSANGKLCEFIENANEIESKFRQLLDEVVNTGSGATDKGGNLWIGIAGKGAWKHSPNSFSVFNERDGIPNESIGPIFGNRYEDVFFVSGNKASAAGNDAFESVAPWWLDRKKPWGNILRSTIRG